MASLAQIIYPPPDQKGWDTWVWHHAQHHEAIERAMAKVLGVAPVVFPLYPFFKDDMQNWLLNHQSAHSRFCQLLNIAGQDLSGLDLADKPKKDDWLFRQYLEHLAAAQRIGTTIT